MSTPPPYGEPRQPTPVYPQPQLYQHPGVANAIPMNRLAVVSFILTIVIAVGWGVARPLVLQSLGRLVATTFDRVGFFVWQWLDLLVPTPLFLVALGLGVAAIPARRSPRGKPLAYMAIGGASVGLILAVITAFMSQLPFSRYF